MPEPPAQCFKADCLLSSLTDVVYKCNKCIKWSHPDCVGFDGDTLTYICCSDKVDGTVQDELVAEEEENRPAVEEGGEAPAGAAEHKVDDDVVQENLADKNADSDRVPAVEQGRGGLMVIQFRRWNRGRGRLMVIQFQIINQL